MKVKATEERVLEAIGELTERNVNVTLENVRKIIGNVGSFSTISSIVKKWKKDNVVPINDSKNMKFCYKSEDNCHDLIVTKWIQKGEEYMATSYLCSKCLLSFTLDDLI